MKNLMTAAVVIASLLSLAGCAGAPPQYYTLSKAETTNTSGSVVAGTKLKGLYALSDISVPAEVDNQALVARLGDGRLLVLSDDRWSGSLSAQLSTAITQTMTRLVGMPPIQKLMSEVATVNVTKIQLDVQRFDLVPGQYVAIDAVWSLRAAGAKTYTTCYTSLRQPVGVGVVALVQGQQMNAEALAAQIAQALLSQGVPTGSRCSTTGIR